MTNRAALFVRSVQCLSSAVMVMISSEKSSIDASVALIYTSKGSAVARWLFDFCFSSCGSKDWCVEFRTSMSQDSSRSRLLPRYISASLTVVYSACAGVVPKGDLKQVKAISSIIAMHTGCVCRVCIYLAVGYVQVYFSNKNSFCWPSASYCRYHV